MASPRRGFWVVGMLALVAAFLVAPVRAQMQPVTPYFAVVSSDDAMLRSGGGDLLYPVAKPTKGQLLRVDGEGAGWSRVAYPPGTAAFVAADAFQVDATGKGGALTKSSKLKAFNMTTGVRGSWKDVLDTPLPAGAKLTLVDTEAQPDGRGGTWYKVAPPDAARAFIQSVGLRKATQEEINALTAPGAKPATGPNGAKPTTGAAPATGPSAPTGAASPTGQPAPTGRSLTEPMVPPTVKPGDLPPTAPTGPGGATGPSDTTGGPAVTVRPVEIPPSPYEKLEAAFDAVRKQPPEQAEYRELMAEIQKAIDGLDDSPASAQIRPRLQQRLNYLKLQTDIRDQRRKLAETQGGFKENDELIRRRLEELDKVRQYTIVGRLSVSTLYDGERLPRMYRLQSVGGPSSRTLAYLKPDPKLGIDSKLGEVVGVVGESVMDPTLRLNIITPLRVDTLEAAPNANPATPAATSGGETPAPAPKPSGG